MDSYAHGIIQLWVRRRHEFQRAIEGELTERVEALELRSFQLDEERIEQGAHNPNVMNSLFMRSFSVSVTSVDIITDRFACGNHEY